jgi:signal peptidase I
MKEGFRKFWQFLKEDSWQSWFVSLIITFVAIKFILFPLLSFALGTSLPLVVVESCSMYHSTSNFNQWWDQNAVWYSSKNISRTTFDSFPFQGGLNKGDIILVSGRVTPRTGNVIIFKANYVHPIIHRVVGNAPLQTKGDNNLGQLAEEQSIGQDQVVGTAVARLPGLGWLKLIFFEGFKPKEERGFCH